ncbi:MAG: thiamine pyrophosphate-dependent enzyme [Flavobacterium nitrogenifigens]|uniref:thiamine pyrophosphate-dependent enzyme n=1 Tax=Flavobacterium nitrogenifigens TaxID=1617283 RepID=UPI0028096C32|nr:thiamine pyrophosphate-dependent enzyme [Flavobacterium nitrogenifigens]MDQ8013202.1 thiamine pyrophosphate-dependent enzyme [Flavobacterium nitrogenifigens]
MKDCNILIRDALESWGITFYAGVTGGGLIHYLKNVDPFRADGDGGGFFNLAEYCAGFAPIGYFLASGKIGAAVATTGAATKLICCGLSDAKLHDIPAVYMVPISGSSSAGFAPLQDSSVFGSNVMAQLAAELPDSFFILDSRATLAHRLSLAKKQLDNSKPVVLVLDNEGLALADAAAPPWCEDQPADVEEKDPIGDFIGLFRKEVKGKRLVVLVGEEVARYGNGSSLTTQLSVQFQAATIWSINGANGAERNNPYGYGYISFGGNDLAVEIFNSLSQGDVLLMLGACPDEYTANFSRISASAVFYASGIRNAYGTVQGSIGHFALGRYYQMHAQLDIFLEELIESSKAEKFENIASERAPSYLNVRPFNGASEGYADMAALHLMLDQWWPADSTGIDDVCLAYKDRQYVVQRPNGNIKFYSLYRGSAMGGAFGAAVGAKLACPQKAVFLFTGDGCFRLFSGSMAEVSRLGLVVFLLNNGTLGIVEQGLLQILPDIDEPHYHSKLQPIDYCAVAEASGWEAFSLCPDFSNLDFLLDKINVGLSKSLMIEIPVDPRQILGSNPRLKNL